MKTPTTKRSIRTLDGKALNVTLPDYLWVVNDHIAEHHKITPSEATRRILRNKIAKETPTETARRVLSVINQGSDSKDVHAAATAKRTHKPESIEADSPRVAEIKEAFGITEACSSTGAYGRPYPEVTFESLRKEALHGGDKFIRMMLTAPKLMAYQLTELEAEKMLQGLQAALTEMKGGKA